MRVNKYRMVHIFTHAAVVLNHPTGKYSGGMVARSFDSFARMIFSRNLDDMHKELNCKEFRRQNAALKLLVAVVRRGISLVTEVTRSFDFKHSVLAVLSGMQKRKVFADGEQQPWHGGERAPPDVGCGGVPQRGGGVEAVVEPGDRVDPEDPGDPPPAPPHRLILQRPAAAPPPPTPQRPRLRDRQPPEARRPLQHPGPHGGRQNLDEFTRDVLNRCIAKNQVTKGKIDSNNSIFYT